MRFAYRVRTEAGLRFVDFNTIDRKQSEPAKLRSHFREPLQKRFTLPRPRTLPGREKLVDIQSEIIFLDGARANLGVWYCRLNYDADSTL